ncbi:hypothetical protein VMCG_04655 [Cytospora schulzeri]|uniref:FAD/NAD(P)-binding domain-containing protein n=1 Tax=Cytospora schulzeri TaxID=448051 RepID=A0A423WRZ3_9PEZI|nr:hypothetical protein VMCG_04655 [Valsa malicola]
MGKTIVILGASVAGIPIAHHLLTHTALLVPDLKVILVSPNTHLYWMFASVRGIVPGGLDEDKLFVPIAPAFAKYPVDRFEFVLGTAEDLNPSENSVTVQTNDGQVRSIEYHTLVVATGSSAKDNMPWKAVSTTEQTRAVLREWQTRIRSAKSIVVAGAGLTGIEVAGELAEAYAKTGQKEVTLIGTSNLPLDNTVRQDVRAAAQNILKTLGARVVMDTTVSTVEGSGSGPRTIKIYKQGREETITADVFMPTYGLQPNSSFAPASMLDQRGYIKQTKYLRVEGHDNIFVVGDVGNLETPHGIHTDLQVLHVVGSLQAYLKGGEVTEYRFSTEPYFGASIGRGAGIGQVKGLKVFSFLIWWNKSRTLGMQKVSGFVAGRRTLTKGKWT